MIKSKLMVLIASTLGVAFFGLVILVGVTHIGKMAGL